MIGLDGRVRPVHEDDAPRLTRMFGRLSDGTIRRRFFSLTPAIHPDPVVRALVDVDHGLSDALVLEVGDEIVAIASYHVRPDDPSVADIAVLVEDGWQHHGIGGRLTRQLSRLARRHGISTFHADVLADNRDAVRLIRHGNHGARASFAFGELAYDLPLQPIPRVA